MDTNMFFQTISFKESASLHVRGTTFFFMCFNDNGYREIEKTDLKFGRIGKNAYLRTQNMFP